MCLFIETIRVEDGNLCNLDYHTRRLNQTRSIFWKDAAPIDLSGLVTPPDLPGIRKCRIVYGKEIDEMTFAPYQIREVSSLRLVADNTIDYTYKKLNREVLNALFLQRGTADDILVVKNGYLTDTSIANIALYDGSKWFTPACPLLKGTKRAELLDKHVLVEKDISLPMIRDYSYMMLFNAMIGWGRIVLPVNEKSLIL